MGHYRRDYRATMDEQDDRSRDLIGRRGGTSATAGKTKRSFTATAPDGKTLKVGSFKLAGKSGPFTMGAYLWNGKWYDGGIFAQNDPIPAWAQPGVRNGQERVLLPAVEVVS